MPIYEYRCQECGGVTEALLKNRREVADVCCQRCGSGRLERAFLSAIAPVRTDTRPEAVPCCGERESCANPKRCCQRET
jgi:putative FmdB family regulatory protein